LPARRRKRILAVDFGVYLVTDRTQTRGRDLVQVVEDALRGGVRAVQLRERGVTDRELVSLGRLLRGLTQQHGAALLVNDRIDVAAAIRADGVHLPARSFAAAEARAILGSHSLIGVSTHSPAEVEAAAETGADFAVFGPVFETPSKRRFGAPLGLPALEEAAHAAAIPVLAIGGLNPSRTPEAIRAGAAGVAVIRSVLAQPDPEGAARALCAAVRAKR